MRMCVYFFLAHINHIRSHNTIASLDAAESSTGKKTRNYSISRVYNAQHWSIDMSEPAEMAVFITDIIDISGVPCMAMDRNGFSIKLKALYLLCAPCLFSPPLSLSLSITFAHNNCIYSTLVFAFAK